MLRWQVLRYVIVGSFNTAAAFAVYSALLWIGLTIPVASLGSLIFGVCLSFITLGRLVFLQQLRGRFLKFVFVWLLLYINQLLVISIFIQLGAGAYWAGLLAGAPTVVLAFLLQRAYVFR